VELTFVTVSLSRKDLKVLVLFILAGGVLQILSRRYIKNHPELFEKKNGNLKKAKPRIQNQNRNPRFRHFFPRGGAFIQLLAITLLVGLIAGSGRLVLSKIPRNAISTVVREALPQNWLESERKRFTLVEGGKIDLDQCDQSLEYLFMILKDTTLPFEEKKKLTRSILTNYFNLKTYTGRVRFVLCMVSILIIFATQDISSYYILLQNLLKAIREGRISKVVGRAIVKKLQKKGFLVDPELLEVVNS
jgi:hypothetical protein